MFDNKPPNVPGKMRKLICYLVLILKGGRASIPWQKIKFLLVLYQQQNSSSGV